MREDCMYCMIYKYTPFDTIYLYLVQIECEI